MARLANWVEMAGAIASKNHSPGQNILHRETIGVKFNRDRDISCKLTYRNKIFDDLWNN
jgi:hypothetical protein